jgi:hypothetical protein
MHEPSDISRCSSLTRHNNESIFIKFMQMRGYRFVRQYQTEADRELSGPAIPQRIVSINNCCEKQGSSMLFKADRLVGKTVNQPLLSHALYV